jgi:hypothetical protein
MRKIAHALALAAVFAGIASVPGRADTAATDSDLYHRMTQVNAHLRSYKADLHADVAMKTFPFLSPSLDGNIYYRQPDKEAVVFDTVPALAAQFKKVYPRIEPPALWPTIYTVSLLGDDGGITTFRLVPRKHGRVSHLDVKTDDASATIKSMTWTYEDGSR